MAEAVQSLLNHHGRSGDEPQLLAALQRLVSKHEQQYRTKERTKTYMLSEVLKKEYIALGQSAQDWQQAVQLGGGQLLRNGVVEPEYIQAAIRNVKELGPYIVLTKGVAVPHAGSEFGVNSTAISLCSAQQQGYLAG